MGTYWTAALPSRPGAERRWGRDHLGAGVLLSRACAAGDPIAASLFELDARLQDRPPGLVEVGRFEDSIWVVESLPAGAIALTSILDAARARQHRIPTEVCIGFVRQLCTTLANAPAAHLRIWPENLFVVAGAPYLVGFGWAEKLPVPNEASAYVPQTPFGDRRDDAFSVAALACALASLSPPAPGAWEALPGPVRECLLNASDAHGAPGRLDPARLGRDIDELMARSHRRLEPEGFVRLIDFLRVGSTTGAETALSPMALTPGEAHAEAWPASDGPSLRADGTVDGTLRPASPPPAFARLAAPEPPLELDLPPPAPANSTPEEPPEPEQRPRFALPRWAFWTLGVVAAAAVAVLIVTLAPKATPMIRIDSEPPGAEVFLGGEELGTTPYAGDNDLAPGTYRVRIELPGYRRFEGDIEGGREAHIRTRLVPARSAAPKPAP